MRSHRPILFFALLASAAALLLTGCPTPMDGTLGAPNAGDTGTGLNATTLTVDPSRGVAVFVDSDGTQTVVESEEGGELIGCVEVIDYDVIEDDADTARYGWSRPGASIRAIILGVRSDGKPGLWIIYRGGGAAFVEGDAEENQQELFESFSEYYEGHDSRWGWDFDVQKMSEESGGVWIIVGTARNPKVEKFFGYVPQVVVYWSLIQKEPGRLILTKARPVAVDELCSKRHWLFYYFRMWSFLWAENYLKELDLDKDIEVDDNDEGIFGIIGTDKNGVKSIGSVTARKVLDIVEYEDNKPNQPPNPPETPPTSLYTIGAGKEFRYPFPSMPVDPDGEEVKLVVGETLYQLDLTQPPPYPVTDTPATDGVFSATNPRFEEANPLTFIINGFPVYPTETSVIYQAEAVAVEIYSEDSRGLRSVEPVILRIYLFGNGS